MFEFFRSCIFCNADLPEDRSDEGEHIFPESIYGFWRTHDVCLECQQTLGNEVDVLATKDVSLLNAMEILKLKDTGPHLDHLPWSGEDTVDKQRVPMVKRGPNFRIKVTKTDDFLECSENDLDKLARPWLRELSRGRLSDDQFEIEYARFIETYKKLAPGETYHSDVFGYSIRRRQTTNVRVDTPNPPAFTRLVAKIVTCFVHYAFPYEKLAAIEELPMLREHARFGRPLRPFTINPLRPLEDGKYFPFHRVVVYPDARITMVDTTFFGNIGWRTVFHSTEPLLIKDDEGRQAEEMLFVLDFTNLANRNKYAGFKYPNNEEINWYEVRG
jgi:hypothetical protein